MRKDTANFPDKFEELREPPNKKSYTDVMYDSVAYDNAPNQTQARNLSRGSGCKNCYSLMLLPDHDRTTQAFPDIMHAAKNVVVGLVDLVTGREDTLKVRKTEEELGRFPGCVTNPQQSSTASKSGMYSMSTCIKYNV